MAATWLIIGANSVIAEAFAACAAAAQHPLILSGRDHEHLEIIAADLRLRYRIRCDILPCDLALDPSPILTCLQDDNQELAVFIAASHIVDNDHLTAQHIDTMLRVNVLSISQIIHAFLQKAQTSHRLIFSSSVAACRGRAKNSLYGGSKAAVECYLQGLQQQAPASVTITIARFGFIDTVQTWGMPGIFYAASPWHCARACWKASQTGRRLIYYPFFWRCIMGILTRLPFFVWRRLKL